MKSIEQRAMEWMMNGERGISSKTICAVMLGQVDKSRKDAVFIYSHPHDPDDFRRCKLLLDVIPEWRANLHKVAEEFPSWRGLVEHWDELETLYAEECSQERAPKLYGRMQEL